MPKLKELLGEKRREFYEFYDRKYRGAYVSTSDLGKDYSRVFAIASVQGDFKWFVLESYAKSEKGDYLVTVIGVTPEGKHRRLKGSRAMLDFDKLEPKLVEGRVEFN